MNDISFFFRIFANVIIIPTLAEKTLVACSRLLCDEQRCVGSVKCVTRHAAL